MSRRIKNHKKVYISNQVEVVAQTCSSMGQANTQTRSFTLVVHVQRDQIPSAHFTPTFPSQNSYCITRQDGSPRYGLYYRFVKRKGLLAFNGQGHDYNQPKPKIGHLEANYPLDLVCLDFTKIDPSKSGKENVLIITDAFS